MTLNVLHDAVTWRHRRRLIVDEIGRLMPDVLCLNEVANRAEERASLQQAITDATGSAFACRHASFQDGGGHAEVIYSREPIAAAGCLRYRLSAQAAVRVVIHWRHIPIAVYATHLDGSHDPRLRIAQAVELSAWIAATNEGTPTIVCGDFNDVPDSATVESFSARFSPTQRRATAFTPLVASTGQPTDPEWPRFDRCIDFIWLGAGLTCLRSELCFVGAGRHWASDHLGIVADIEVT